MGNKFFNWGYTIMRKFICPKKKLDDSEIKMLAQRYNYQQIIRTMKFKIKLAFSYWHPIQLKVINQIRYYNILRMKTFNSRSAVEEYMSAHSLGFSTPDLTLKEFVIWLCEQVYDPKGKEMVPRIMLYLKGEEGAE